MKALLLKTTENPSKYGGKFYYAFFKSADGRSFRSCLDPKMANFRRWLRFIGKENIELDGLVAKGSLIDADSHPVEV
jgi:hypothetical protein